MSISLLSFTILLHATAGMQPVLRSDDTHDPMAAVIQALSAKVTQLEAQLNADHALIASKDRQVAFMAQFSRSTNVTMPSTGPYKFDYLLVNDGNGYDPALGVFTAPTPGVYIISAQFFSYGGTNGRPLIDIKINGIPRVRVGFDAGSTTSTGEDSDSTTFTAKLNTGDRVWASAAGNEIYALWGSIHSFLSGALLYSI